MKIFCIFWIFLQFAPALLLDPFKSYCLDEMNSFRAQYAHLHQIANLNRLVYDKKLEKILRAKLEDVKGCPTSSGFQSLAMDHLVYMFRENNMEEQDLHAMFDYDSSEMACFDSKCNETGENINSFVIDMGHHKRKHGPPGTMCQEQRVPDGTGLCVFLPETDEK